MMKVLHINCTDAGSTGKIIAEISEYIVKKGCLSLLCTPKITSPETTALKKFKTSGKYEPAIYKRFTMFTGYRYASSPIATQRILRIIDKQNPNVIHLHSVNCYMANIYSILKYATKKKIAVVITNHAEFYYTGSCPHAYECDKWITGCGSCPSLWNGAHSKLFDMTANAWNKMKVCISNLPYVQVVSVSPWVEKRSSTSGIMEGISQCTILNGVDINTFHRIECVKDLKEQHHISGKIVLFVTALFSDSISDVKGGKFIISLAHKLVGQATVLVVGKKHIASELPDNLVAVGEIRDQKLLADYYNMADISVTAGKKETFGMTVAESLCCGTPVVGFEAGGPESIALAEYSEFVPYGDESALYTTVLKWLNHSKTDMSEDIEKMAHERYASDVMASQYFDVYQNLIHESSNE